MLQFITTIMGDVQQMVVDTQPGAEATQAYNAPPTPPPVVALPPSAVPLTVEQLKSLAASAKSPIPAPKSPILVPASAAATSATIMAALKANNIAAAAGAGAGALPATVSGAAVALKGPSAGSKRKAATSPSPATTIGAKPAAAAAAGSSERKQPLQVPKAAKVAAAAAAGAANASPKQLPVAQSQKEDSDTEDSRPAPKKARPDRQEEQVDASAEQIELVGEMINKSLQDAVLLTENDASESDRYVLRFATAESKSNKTPTALSPDAGAFALVSEHAFLPFGIKEMECYVESAGLALTLSADKLVLDTAGWYDIQFVPAAKGVRAKCPLMGPIITAIEFAKFADLGRTVTDTQKALANADSGAADYAELEKDSNSALNKFTELLHAWLTEHASGNTIVEVSDRLKCLAALFSAVSKTAEREDGTYADANVNKLLTLTNSVEKLRADLSVGDEIQPVPAQAAFKAARLAHSIKQLLEVFVTLEKSATDGKAIASALYYLQRISKAGPKGAAAAAGEPKEGKTKKTAPKEVATHKLERLFDEKLYRPAGRAKKMLFGDLKAAAGAFAHRFSENHGRKQSAKARTDEEKKAAAARGKEKRAQTAQAKESMLELLLQHARNTDVVLRDMQVLIRYMAVRSGENKVPQLETLINTSRLWDSTHALEMTQIKQAKQAADAAAAAVASAMKTDADGDDDE